MARREIITDDFDGTQPATSVTFAFQGQGYAIDLSDEHLQQMKDLLAPYIAAGQQLQDLSSESDDATSALEDIVAPEKTERARRTRPREERVDWRRHEPRTKAELHRAARSFGVRAGLMSYGQRGAVPDYVLREFYVAHPTAWREGDTTEPTEAPSLPMSTERNVTVDDEVLAWARKFGYPVRGKRVPASTLAAYERRQAELAAKSAQAEPDQMQDVPEDDGAAVAEVTGQGATQAPASAQASTDDGPDMPSEDEVLAEFGVEHEVPVIDPAAWDGEYSSASTSGEENLSSAPMEDVELPEPAPAASSKPGRNHNRIYPVGIRAWARAHGYRVGNGFIKPEVIEAFESAHSN